MDNVEQGNEGISHCCIYLEDYKTHDVIGVLPCKWVRPYNTLITIATYNVAHGHWLQLVIWTKQNCIVGGVKLAIKHSDEMVQNIIADCMSSKHTINNKFLWYKLFTVHWIISKRVNLGFCKYFFSQNFFSYITVL